MQPRLAPKERLRQPVQLKNLVRYVILSTRRELKIEKKDIPKEMDIRQFGYLATRAFQKNCTNTSSCGKVGARVVRLRPSFVLELSRQMIVEQKSSPILLKSRRRKSKRPLIVGTLVRKENLLSGGQRKRLALNVWLNDLGPFYRWKRSHVMDPLIRKIRWSLNCLMKLDRVVLLAIGSRVRTLFDHIFRNMDRINRHPLLDEHRS